MPTLTYFVAIGAYLLLQGIFHAVGHTRHVDDDGAKGLAVIIFVLVVGPAAVAATESGTIRAHWRERRTR